MLGVLLLFMVTDSRSIKFLAENILPEHHFTYDRLEGNLFDGLELSNLRYENRILFHFAKLHWNPLELMSHKISVTEVDAQGVELDNLLKTINTFASKKSKQDIRFDLGVSVKNLHLDINPYIYEGVKFSSFDFDAKEIKMDRAMNINTRLLSLSFDSDLVNAKLNGRIKESVLEIEEAGFQEIDSKAITRLVQRILKHQQKKVSEKITFKKEPVQLFKTIKIKHLGARLKAVDYKPLQIRSARLFVSDLEFDPVHQFSYKAKLMRLQGKTNFGKINFRGHIDKSTMITKGTILASKALFKRYSLPLNYKTLHKLPAKLRLSHDGVWLEVNHKVKNLLRIKSDFNLNVKKAEHKLHYNYHTLNLNIESQLKVDMPYGKGIEIKNKTLIDKSGKTTYTGVIKFKKVKNLPPMVADYLLKNLKAKYKGNTKGLALKLDSSKLTGHFKMPDYKHATLHLESKTSNLGLKRLFPNIPKTLENERVLLKSDSTFDFLHLNRSKLKLNITSKLINLESSMRLDKPYTIVLKGDVPRSSHIQRVDKNINIKALRHLKGEIIYDDNTFFIKFKNNKNLDVSFVYVPKNKILRNGKIHLGKEEIVFSINRSGHLILRSKVKKIENLLAVIKQHYTVELPPLEGSFNLYLKQQDKMNYLLDLQSPQIQYSSKKGLEPSILNINKIEVSLKLNKRGKIVLNQYKFKLDNNEYIKDFHSIKQSFFNFKNGKLDVKSLWINDIAELKGVYNTKKGQGNLHLFSKGFRLKQKDFDLIFALDIAIALNKEKIALEGDIKILGNTISYELEGSNIVEDADIIVVQDILKKEESALTNLKLYLKIKNRENSPLRYFARDTQIEFYNELLIVKNYNSDIFLTGMSTITKGFYRFEEKQFTLDESHFYFAGDIKKPLMDIKANYTKDQYVIHIFISGTSEEPIVNFNSDPYLSQQQILSLILFDGTGSGKGAEAYTLLGGTFAKGLIKSLGINVDHLLLGTDINDELSLEIGRRISKNVTVMYIHDEGQDGAKVQIEHGSRFETDIIIQPPKHSSIEFLYKRDR